MLKVYKASAGSGKTFQLVAEYLKLVLENPFQYKHILAVTFTNKATNEMKGRILQQLYFLANDQDSPYLTLLSETLQLTEKEIKSRANNVLRNLLHDFNRFSISTIDTFTQRIIKSFNREIGISPQYKLELNETLILEEAIDRFLSNLNKDPKLLQWVSDYAEEKARRGNSFRIENDLSTLGKELSNEQFQIFIADTKETHYTRKNIEILIKELKKNIRAFELKVQKLGEDFLKSIHDHGYTINDFSNKSNGFVGYFIKLSNNFIDFPDEKKRLLNAEKDIESWITKSHPQRDQLIRLANSTWHSMLVETTQFIRDNFIHWNTSKLVLKDIRVLGILNNLKKEIKEIMHERGGLQISNANLLLQQIIGNSSSPFIYEKIGNYYKNFMLDEFQDTSAMQWNNFKPLLENSLAEGNDNLLVGDVKQSIYRFRNSDWDILASKVENEFKQFDYLERTLDSNWSSQRKIIEFNNHIIEQFKNGISGLIQTNIQEPNDYQSKLDQAYDSYQQKVAKENNGGYINTNFFDKEEFHNESNNNIIEQVKQLQNNGFKASDIAILIRKNNEGTEIINTFLDARNDPNNSDYNLSVISNESLFLNASKGVAFVIHLIELMVNPKNEITKVALLYSWINWLQPQLMQRGIKLSSHEQLSFYFTDDYNWDNTYNQSFKETIQPHYEEVKEKIAQSAIDEAIMLICNQFKLFKIDTELPFLQTLIDSAAEIKHQIPNDLSNFLNWWYEEGNSISVNTNDEIDSIKLITVHKSKGLEFEAVILPYFNWSVTSNRSNIIWVEPEKEPFNILPLLPVKSTKSLAHSYFKDAYFNETFNNYIDTLNLVYVAFTRAKSALIINGINYRNKKSDYVDGILHNSLQNLSKSEKFQNCWIDDDKTQFVYGTITPIERKNTLANNAEVIENYVFEDFSDRIQLRVNDEEFLTIDDRNHSTKNLGRVVHEILADVETIKDLSDACRKAMLNGLINEKEQIDIYNTLKIKLNQPKVKEWFDGFYEVINERTILSPKKILRPDRIMIKKNHAIIVDYKWGENITDSNIKQVQNYMKVLAGAGYDDVEGYLWYINADKIQKIDKY